MKRKDMIQEKFDELRRETEVLIMEKGFESHAVIYHDPLELINELQASQVELEQQNDELQRSQQELMEFKTQYTELYDFIPVGYVCLDMKGVIRNANLTLADMLSKERNSMIDQPLTRYVFFEDQDTYNRHFKDFTESKTRQICELRMRKSDVTLVDVQPESSLFPYQSWRPEQYRTVIIDISGCKQMGREQEALRLRLHQSHKLESIRTIAGGIAHDFNNILFIITGIVDLVLEETKAWHPAYPIERIRPRPAGGGNCQAVHELQPDSQ